MRRIAYEVTQSLHRTPEPLTFDGLASVDIAEDLPCIACH